jgi:hypothetical protein
MGQTSLNRSNLQTSKAATSITRNHYLLYGFVLIIGFAFIEIMYKAAIIIGQSHSYTKAISYFYTHLATIILTITLWLILSRAILRLKAYISTVNKTQDGKALNKILIALFLSLVYAMLFAVASTFKTLFWHHTDFKTVTTITNLLPIPVMLSSSLVLFKGTSDLLKNKAVEDKHLNKKMLGMYLLIVLAVVFAYGVYFHSHAAKLVDDDGFRHFVISVKTLMYVYVLPYALIWLLGLMSCLNLEHYAKHVKGIVYKELFRDLYSGISMSFVGIYLLQIFYVSNVSSAKLGAGLLFIVCLLVILIRGCLLISRGSDKLARVEIIN